MAPFQLFKYHPILCVYIWLLFKAKDDLIAFGFNQYMTNEIMIMKLQQSGHLSSINMIKSIGKIGSAQQGIK